MRKATLKEKREIALRIILRCGGVENLLNRDVVEWMELTGSDITDWQNTKGYFEFTKQGRAKLEKAMVM